MLITKLLLRHTRNCSQIVVPLQKISRMSSTSRKNIVNFSCYYKMRSKFCL